MNEGLTLFELINDNWKEVEDFKCSIIVGESPMEKTICFSPNEGKIYQLETKIECDDNNISFSDNLSKKWSLITPSILKSGEKSNPLKIKFKASGGSYRMSSFQILAKYLQGPEDV